MSIPEVTFEIEPSGQVLSTVSANWHALVPMLPEARGGANRVNRGVVLLHVCFERGQIAKGLITSPALKNDRDMPPAAANGISCGGSLEGSGV